MIAQVSSTVGALRRMMSQTAWRTLKAEKSGAMRRGLGRSAGLFTVPAPLLRAAFYAARQPAIYRLLAGRLVADASALAGLGWAATIDSAAGLERLMHGAAHASTPSST